MPASFFNSRCAVRTITALLFCLSTLPTAQARQQDVIESLYQKARAAESQKQFEQAAELYERILKLDPVVAHIKVTARSRL